MRCCDGEIHDTRGRTKTSKRSWFSMVQIFCNKSLHFWFFLIKICCYNSFSSGFQELEISTYYWWFDMMMFLDRRGRMNDLPKLFNQLSHQIINKREKPSWRRAQIQNGWPVRHHIFFLQQREYNFNFSIFLGLIFGRNYEDNGL